jgi:AcrR family transcriptional regulator
MPRPRFEKLATEKRERILETAAREFAHHGYDGASLNHILAEAGISKGAAYYYFDDKSDLFATVLEHYWVHVLGEANFAIDRLDAPGFWPKINELYRQALNHAFEQPWILPLFKSLWKPWDMGALPAPLAARIGALREWLLELLERGQKLGTVRTDLPLDLLFALMAGMDDAADRWLMENWTRLDRERIQDLSMRMLDMVRRMLAPPAEGKR